MKSTIRHQVTAIAVPKTTGQTVSFGVGIFSCTKVLPEGFERCVALCRAFEVRFVANGTYFAGTQRNQEGAAPALRPSS